VLLKAPLRVASVVAAAAVRSPLGGIVLLLTPWTRGTWGTIRKSRPQELLRLAMICWLSFGSALLYTGGIKHAGVAVGTVLSSTAPLFTIPLEILVLQRRPSVQTILGALITVIGIALMNF
jgi:drug/metabolite transporter (DMT)-like permease